MTLLPTAIVCCLLAIILALIGVYEHDRGRRPAWLFTMAFVLAVAGVVMGAVHVFAT